MSSSCFSRGSDRIAFRLLGVIALTSFLMMTSGCATWKATPVTRLTVDDPGLTQKSIRFHLQSGEVVGMRVVEIDYPFVRGWPLAAERSGEEIGSGGQDSRRIADIPEEQLQVDCRDVVRMEILRTDVGVAIVVAAVAVTAAVLVIAAIGSGGGQPPPSSQSSCPTLYVRGEGGPRLVGEVFAGAAVRAVQRDDLMPLPGVGAGPMQCIMVNEARETQYTDFAELVLADHEPGTRAVATCAQQVLLVGPSQPPLSAIDALGTDRTDEVVRADERLWQTDLAVLAEQAAPRLTEELVLAFPRPAAGDQAVLELECGNTYWLDMVMNRFLALMGGGFKDGMERAGRPKNGPRLKEWLRREGIELKVESWGSTGWKEVAYVPSVGPLALRHVAVPLPADCWPADDATIRIRVSGGSGFWMIDQVALSTVSPGSATVHHLAPVGVTGADGSDQAPLVAAVDGRYQVLSDTGDRFDLAFDVPAAAPGVERTAFFHSNGYYVAHEPIQNSRSVATLKTILDEKGALARFSLDLYRKYCDIAARSPVRADGRS